MVSELAVDAIAIAIAIAIVNTIIGFGYFSALSPSKSLLVDSQSHSFAADVVVIIIVIIIIIVIVINVIVVILHSTTSRRTHIHTHTICHSPKKLRRIGVFQFQSRGCVCRRSPVRRRRRHEIQVCDELGNPPHDEERWQYPQEGEVLKNGPLLSLSLLLSLSDRFDIVVIITTIVAVVGKRRHDGMFRRLR